MQYNLLLYFFLLWGGMANAQLSSLKFDVDIELDHIVIANVKDLDGTEDLTGSHFLDNATALTKKVICCSSTPSVTCRWKRTKEELRYLTSYPNGTVRIDKKSRLFSNLTLEELKNITITTQSQVWDDEGWLESLPFVCVSCSSQGAMYTMYFNQQQETQNSINSLVNSGLPQALKFGGDTYFEVDHYEKGIKDNGWARFKWRVWVTPHN